MDSNDDRNEVLETPKRSLETSRPVISPPVVPQPHRQIGDVLSSRQDFVNDASGHVDNARCESSYDQLLSFPFSRDDSASTSLFLGDRRGRRRRSNSFDVSMPFPTISLRPRIHGRGSVNFSSTHSGDPGCTCLDCLCSSVTSPDSRGSDRNILSRHSHFRSNTFGGFDSSIDIFSMVFEAEKEEANFTTVTHEYGPFGLSTLSQNLPPAVQAFIPPKELPDDPLPLPLTSRGIPTSRSVPRHRRPSPDMSFLKSVSSQECLQIPVHHTSTHHIRSSSYGTQSLSTASPQNTETPDWGHHSFDDSPVFRQVQEEAPFSEDDNHIKMVRSIVHV